MEAMVVAVVKNGVGKRGREKGKDNRFRNDSFKY